MVDNLYYSSRKITKRCENSFVDYRINYQKICYLLRQITKDLNSASVSRHLRNADGNGDFYRHFRQYDFFVTPMVKLHSQPTFRSLQIHRSIPAAINYLGTAEPESNPVS